MKRCIGIVIICFVQTILPTWPKKWFRKKQQDKPTIFLSRTLCIGKNNDLQVVWVSKKYKDKKKLKVYRRPAWKE